MTDEDLRQIYIQNLPYEIEEDELREWCATFGRIVKCSLKRDPEGKSRGFGFVTYATIEGHNNILSHRPHYCRGRELRVRTANGHLSANDNYHDSPSDYPSQATLTNENFQSNPMESNFMYDGDYDDDDSHNQLASLRDELDANLECLDITHKRELKLLQDRLTREKKLRDNAEELYKEAEEDWRKANEENLRLRTNLVKNVMQTFNIRRNFARQTKEQRQKCQQLEQQFQDNTANRSIRKQT